LARNPDFQHRDIDLTKMSDVPVTRCQHQPVCPPAFPPHSLSTHPYGTITLEEYGIQCFESLANIANAQYYEPEESQHASQMREESELDAWSRNVNALPDAREEIAQSKLPRHLSVPMICHLGSSVYRESVAMSAAHDRCILCRICGVYGCSSVPANNRRILSSFPKWGYGKIWVHAQSTIQAIGQVLVACDHGSYIHTYSARQTPVIVSSIIKEFVSRSKAERSARPCIFCSPEGNCILNGHRPLIRWITQSVP
jgi:hypothetical protein